jgi:hypothetical protein
MPRSLLLIALILSALCSASAQAKLSTKYFKATEATVQSWSAGASRNTGKMESGFIYQVKATVTKGNLLQFDSLIVDGNSLAIEVVKGTQRNYRGPFSKGEQITILARTENGGPARKASAILLAGIAKRKEAGFISYRANGKAYLFPVSKFTSVSNQTKNQ